LLIRTSTTLISAGTERTLAQFGKASWLDKIRQQPDKVRMVLDKVRSDGVAATIAAVRSKLDQPHAPGYCNVGIVTEVGVGVDALSRGDRVASNGKHAEIVSVPSNLCSRVPDGVSDEEAAFTVLGAIGLQGIRLIQPTLGECVVVTGLGLVGLMTVQMLRAHGCRVLGIDMDPERLDLARRFGAEVANPAQGDDVLAVAQRFSRGRGVDAVIIAAATKSNEPLSQAAQMCRQRGRIVLVGVVGMELSRADFYAKELTFQVSCSYGPGRYDPAYEESGHDYPFGLVRWTEQRNFEAVLEMMAAGTLDVKPLISHRFDIDSASAAYDLLISDASSLGILINYPTRPHAAQRMTRIAASSPVSPAATGKAVVAFIGAGNYGSRALIPAFRDAQATLHTLVSANGVSAAHYGSKFGFAQTSSDASAAISDPLVDTVVVCTRHNTHAELALQALAAGKHVFVEKPVCLTLDELTRIANAAGRTTFMVGFNRRFAPQTKKIEELLATLPEPKSFIMTVNAGAIPPDHWIHDPAIGGGRIVGEACHYIDLLRHLAGTPITGFSVVGLGAPDRSHRDNASITLRFADSSVGTIHYLANGNPRFPKERLEIFGGRRILQLDNFRKLRGWGWSGFARMNLWRQDKGQTACASAFVGAVRSGTPSPIPLDEIVEVGRVSIEVQAALA
jgi:predicted dehydrogenase